jgi:hypothetical protein
MNTVMRTLGGALGGQIVATFLADNLGAGGLPSSGAYGQAFAVCAGALVVAVAVGFLIPRRRRAAVERSGAQLATAG